ncbi:MAG: zinc ribbon domain-containing protein, partial [Chloroflexota bacterium]
SPEDPATISADKGNPPPWPDNHATLTGSNDLRQAKDFFGEQSDTDFGMAEAASPDAVTFTGQVTGNSAGGLGGSGGGLDGLGHDAPASFDGSGFGGGGESVGHDAAGDALGQVNQVQPDQFADAQSSARPTDYHLRPPSPADGAPQPVPGGDLGGGHGSDALARGAAPGTTGSELASAHGPGGGLGGAEGGLASGGPTDALARSSGTPSDLLAQGSGSVNTSSVSPPVDSGLGGVHGGVDGGGSLARHLTAPEPGVELAKYPAGPPTGDPGMQGGLGGERGLHDGLARGLGLSDGQPLADGSGSVAPGTTGLGAVGPGWLAAGALARAGAYDLPDDQAASQQEREGHSVPPRARQVRCPACDRDLPPGPRFCGYCGEPLDRTMA